MHYANKRATAETSGIHSSMCGFLKTFYFDFILLGFSDMIMQKFFFSYNLKNIKSKKAVFIYRFKF